MTPHFEKKNICKDIIFFFGNLTRYILVFYFFSVSHLETKLMKVIDERKETVLMAQRGDSVQKHRFEFV